MPALSHIFGAIGLTALCIAAGYCLLTVVASVVWHVRRKQSAASPGSALAVTILKPLCGAEPGLYENLRSFCRQDHNQFQIVFGVRDRSDPALGVAQRLVAEFPDIPIDIVIDARLHGSNRKVSTLINMLPAARFDLLALADSDAFVGPDYLNSITTAFAAKEVGLVTCLYHGEPTPGIWSRLGAMYVNEWYMPSVLLAWMFGHDGYASGQTLCIRRDTLESIGGLASIADHLADDYRLGELVRSIGQRLVLSYYQLKAEHHEPTFDVLLRHELRWMRTLRALRPASFRLLFFSFTTPLALVGWLLCASQPAFSVPALVLFQLCWLGRLALYFGHRLPDRRSLFTDLWLLPARDLLLCWVWYRSLLTSRISWRGHEFEVDAHGTMRSAS